MALRVGALEVSPGKSMCCAGKIFVRRKRAPSTRPRQQQNEAKRPCYRERFSARAERAAIIIQSWYRKSVRVWVWNAHTTDWERQCGHRGVIVLVEPIGGAINLRAAPLACLFIATGRFDHPITRRPLNLAETRRLQRLVPPECALMIEFTRMFQRQVQDASSERESLIFFLHSQAGECLDRALLNAEDEDASDRAFEDLLGDYEDAVLQVRSLCEESLFLLLQQHQKLIERRRRTAVSRASLHALLALINVMQRRNRKTTEILPAAFVCWLSQSGNKS